jgi:hypothetical protein
MIDLQWMPLQFTLFDRVFVHRQAVTFTGRSEIKGHNYSSNGGSAAKFTRRGPLELALDLLLTGPVTIHVYASAESFDALIFKVESALTSLNGVRSDGQEPSETTMQNLPKPCSSFELLGRLFKFNSSFFVTTKGESSKPRDVSHRFVAQDGSEALYMRGVGSSEVELYITLNVGAQQLQLVAREAHFSRLVGNIRDQIILDSRAEEPVKCPG